MVAEALLLIMAVWGFVILDTSVTHGLAAEGLARDVVRAVRAAVDAHADLIRSETLAEHLGVREQLDGATVAVGSNQKITLEVQRA